MSLSLPFRNKIAYHRTWLKILLHRGEIWRCEFYHVKNSWLRGSGGTVPYMLGNLKVVKTVNGESQGVLHLLAPHETLCAYSVNLPAVSVWHVWALTDTMDYQCIIVYTIITILPPNRPGLAADTQWEPQGTAARACCFAWIKCCIMRCAFCVLWIHSNLPWKFDSSCNMKCAFTR